MNSLSIWIGFAIGAAAGALAIGLVWFNWERHHALRERRRGEAEGGPIDTGSGEPASDIPYSNSAGT